MYTKMWAHRRNTVVTEDLGTTLIDLTNAYMQCYRRITQQLVSPLIARPVVNFQSVGSIIELLVICC